MGEEKRQGGEEQGGREGKGKRAEVFKTRSLWFMDMSCSCLAAMK